MEEISKTNLAEIQKIIKFKIHIEYQQMLNLTWFNIVKFLS